MVFPIWKSSILSRPSPPCSCQLQQSWLGWVFVPAASKGLNHKEQANNGIGHYTDCPDWRWHWHSSGLLPLAVSHCLAIDGNRKLEQPVLWAVGCCCADGSVQAEQGGGLTRHRS